MSLRQKLISFYSYFNKIKNSDFCLKLRKKKHKCTRGNRRGHRFSFYFNIKLHLDDIKVLHYIKKLEVGKIYTHKNTATFRISKYEELQKLFNILEIKPLNTTKYLNHFAFKEGLLLYQNKTRSTNLSLTEN